MPAMLDPVCWLFRSDRLKYPPIASFTCLLLLTSHSTMNSAIMAVTKSA